MISALLEIYDTYRPEPAIAQQRNEQLRALNDKQFTQLEQALLEKVRSGDKAQIAIAEDVVSDLLVHTSFSVDALLCAMLQADYAPLDHLFRGAGQQTENALLATLQEMSKPEMALRALAWIDRENITAMFIRWKREEALPLLDLYTKNAGWEIDASFQKRWLFSKECDGLKAKSSIENGEYAAPADSPEHCKWCDRPLYTLIDFHTNHLKQLFGIDSLLPNLSIPFCMYCTQFEPILMSLKTATGSCLGFNPRIRLKTIEPPNYKLETNGGNLELRISESTRNPFAAVDSGRSYNLSQVGGFPTWPQDATFPQCVECGQTMLFFMQIESMDFPLLQYEGVYHFFTCQHCSTEFAVQQSC